MTTVTINTDTIVVLIKPDEYKWIDINAVGKGFEFYLDEVGQEFLAKLVHDKDLIYNGRIFATNNDIVVNKTCTRLLTLEMGRDYSNEEAIIVVRDEEI